MDFHAPIKIFVLQVFFFNFLEILHLSSSRKLVYGFLLLLCSYPMWNVSGVGIFVCAWQEERG